MNTTENKKIMARNIKKYMEKKGITNKQICADLDFKYTTFMDWKKGVTYPRIGKVEAMANYFGCEKSDLIENKPENFDETQKKADSITEAVLRMKKDSDFLSLIEMLTDVDSEKIQGVKQMLSAFLK